MEVVEDNNHPMMACYGGVDSNAQITDATADPVQNPLCQYGVGENAAAGTVAATVAAWDGEGDALQFFIVSGNDLGAFELRSRTLAAFDDNNQESYLVELVLSDAAVSQDLLDFEAEDADADADSVSDLSLIHI